MSIIKTKNLSKNFGEITALDGINLEVKEGEVYGYIGPNGAGKTTTLRILLGIIKADQGKATVFGQNSWRDAVDIHRKVAYVPGEINLWPNLTGGEIIDLFLKLRDSNNKSRREEFIEKFDLDPSKKCSSYSKGNRQKVALVAAFAADADLYLLDEPSSGLDPLMEKVFQECVMEFKDQGKTVFLSSHILSEVEKLCDKVSIIRQGEIIESGSLDQLRHLMRTRILVKTKQEITALEERKGVHDLQKKNDSIIFQVDAEKLNDIVHYLSKFKIEKLESSPPKLEDIFMHHYHEEGDQQ
ncbi:MAG: ABC transporter ATP-binding protein [Halanaerobiales bacterium]